MISRFFSGSFGLHFSLAYLIYSLSSSWSIYGRVSTVSLNFSDSTSRPYFWTWGWFLRWELITKVARFLSIYSLTSSLMTQRTSNLDRMGSVRSTFYLNDKLVLYLPWTGFAAAITEHLALSVVTIPALDIEIVCCSMASWIDVLSC